MPITYLRTIEAQSDIESLKLLESVAFKNWLVEDIPQSALEKLVSISRSRLQASALGLPVLLLSGLKFPALFCLSNKLRLLKALQGISYFGQRSLFSDRVYDTSCDICFGSGEVPDEF